MATGKKFYWIKLKDSFMQSDEVDFIMSQKNGASYIILYQLLCLKTVNTNGRLGQQIGDSFVPYDAKKIQRDCRWFSLGLVRSALEMFKAYGFIGEDEDGVLFISDYENLVGSATDWSEKKKRQRTESSGDTDGDKGGDIVPIENKRIRDKDNIYTAVAVYNAHARAREPVENSENDEPVEKSASDIGKLLRLKGSVMLTDDQVGDLLERLGIDAFDYYLDRLSSFIERGGKVKNHYATILKWHDEDREVKNDG